MVNCEIRLIIFNFIFHSQKWRISLQSAETRPGFDHSPDHELLIAKFRLKLKKIQKTNSPFSHDLNQTHYDYTVKVTNRFKGLDLIDKGPEELWTEVCNIVQEAVNKTIPQKKKCNAKWLSEDTGKIVEKIREVKSKEEREGYPSECRVPKNSKER